MSKFSDAGNTYLPAMYGDTYFPKQIVDKVRAQLELLVGFLEGGNCTSAEIQTRCDEIVDAINELQTEFDEAGSEIETAARDDIAETVARIFKTYGVAIDIEEALRNRDW